MMTNVLSSTAARRTPSCLHPTTGRAAAPIDDPPIKIRSLPFPGFGSTPPRDPPPHPPTNKEQGHEPHATDGPPEALPQHAHGDSPDQRASPDDRRSGHDGGPA